jgi:hypothetical protein
MGRGARWRAGIGWALAAGLAAGCGSGPAGPGDVPPFDFTFADPAGDTAAATLNPRGAPAIDLLTLSGTVAPDEVDLTLEFGGSVTPWSARSVDGLDGFVYFDIDQNPATGATDNPHQLGADFYLDLRDNGFGRVAVVDPVSEKFVLVKAVFEGNRFTATIPRAAITLATDRSAAFRFAVDLSARERTPVTDRGPDTGSYLVAPPLP